MNETPVNPKKRGLGRGLNALFEDEEGYGGALAGAAGGGEPDAAALEAAGHKRLSLGIDQIDRNPGQPRRIFKEESLEELAASIKEHGILQPLLVRPLADPPGLYEIVAGERRWQAAQRAQLHEVPVIVLEGLDEEKVFKLALVENLQREDLDPIDEALGYKKLVETYGHSPEDVAKAIGKSRSHVANMVRLLNLPDKVQSYLSAGEISMGHARALITADRPEELVKDIVKNEMSVREVEKMVAGMRKGDWPQGSDRMSGKGKDTDTQALETDLSNRLGMRVSIDSKDGTRGRVSIQFKSLDQLDEILKRLAG